MYGLIDVVWFERTAMRQNYTIQIECPKWKSEREEKVDVLKPVTKPGHNDKWVKFNEYNRNCREKLSCCWIVEK